MSNLIKTKSSEAGLNTVESCLTMFVALLILLAVIVLVVGKPFGLPSPAAITELANKGVLIVLIGGLIGVIAWFGKQTSSTINNRTQLRILEILSNGQQLTRRELRMLLRKEHFVYKLIPELNSDALAALVNAGKVVVIENEKYTLTQFLPTPNAISERKGIKPKGKR